MTVERVGTEAGYVDVISSGSVLLSPDRTMVQLGLGDTPAKLIFLIDPSVASGSYNRQVEGNDMKVRVGPVKYGNATSGVFSFSVGAEDVQVTFSLSMFGNEHQRIALIHYTLTRSV